MRNISFERVYCLVEGWCMYVIVRFTIIDAIANTQAEEMPVKIEL